MATSQALRLYASSIPSGNVYKVELLAAQIGLELELVYKDILATPPETRTPDFLDKSPNGRVPILEWPDGRVLAESNAILFHLAKASRLWPEDAWDQAKVMQWLFFEQYSHEPYVAVLKFWTYWGGLDQCPPETLKLLRERGLQALRVMETQLKSTRFLAGEQYTIADIALFAYTQTAEAIGYPLGDLPQVRRWLNDVRATPNFFEIAAPEPYAPSQV